MRRGGGGGGEGGGGRGGGEGEGGGGGREGGWRVGEGRGAEPRQRQSRFFKSCPRGELAHCMALGTGRLSESTILLAT